jgi:hypothetical protein
VFRLDKLNPLKVANLAETGNPSHRK